MTKQTRAMILIFVLSIVPQGAFAESKPLEVKWNELPALIGGHRVALELTNGVTVKGEAVAVREDAILVDVASAVTGYPKGNGQVPRASVGLIALERSRGGWGRTLGTVVGVIGGLAIGGYVAGTATDSAGAAIPTFIGIASGISVGGYFAGKSLDRRVTRIRVVP